MACNLSLNAPNGEKSILFKDIAKVSNNNDVTIDTYYFTKTDAFKKEYGDWEKGEVSSEFLDENGEPLYSSFMDKDYVVDKNFAEVELDKSAEMYKKISDTLPKLAFKLTDNIEMLSKTGGNPKLLKKLRALKPLLMGGDVTTSLPKFVESAKNHIKALSAISLIKNNFKSLQRAYKNSSSYAIVLELLDDINSNIESNEIFEESIFSQGAEIRADLADIESRYLEEAKNFLADEFHSRNKGWSKYDIKKWLKESPSDTKNYEYMLEAVVDSKDKILSAVADMVTDQELAVTRDRIEFDDKLVVHIEKISKEAISKNPDKAFDDVIYQNAEGELHVLDVNAKDTFGKDKRQDAEYKVIQSLRKTKPALIDFLIFYSDTMRSLNSGIPESAVIGTRLPTIFKTSLERMQGKSIKERGKLIGDEIHKTVLRSNTDIEMGQLSDSNGKPIRKIPTFFAQKFDSVDFDAAYLTKYKELIKDGMEVQEAELTATEYGEKIAKEKMATLLSRDLVNSLQSFHRMAINFSSKNEIIDAVEAARDIVGSKKRRYVAIDKANRVIFNKNAAGEKVPSYRIGTDSNTAKTLNTFIDMHVYGQKEDDLSYFTLFGKKYDNNKSLRTINRMTSLVQMSLNFLASSANLAVGEYNNNLEVIAGEFTNRESYNKAGKLYRKSIGDTMADIGGRKSNSIINQLNDHYNILGEYDAKNTRYNEGSKVSRLFKTSSLFFMQGSGEHFMQSRLGMSILDATKTYNKDGKETGTILDAHTKGDGKVNIAKVFVMSKEGTIVPYDVSQQNRIAKKISAVIRKTHGNYSSSTATAAKKDARTAMLLKYRDWAYEGLVKRFGKTQEYLHLEQDATGFYRQGFQVMKKLVTDLEGLKFDLLKEDWQKLTPAERANVKRLVSESAMIVSLIASSVILGHAGKDLEDTWDDDTFQGRLAHGGFNYLVYMVNRIKTEIFAYTNPVEALRLLQSPAASTTLIENTIKLLSQFMMNPLEVRETGRDKGSLEIAIKASRLIPAYKNLSRLTPQGIKDSGVFYIF